MAKPRKVWFHTGTGYWCAKINGRRHYLDRDRAAAQKKLNKMLAEGDGTARAWLDRPLMFLVNEFLKDVQARRSPATFADYGASLGRALVYLPAGLLVAETKKIHLARLEQELAKKGSSPTTTHKTIHALQRVFTWAVETDLLDGSPLAGYRKPRPRQRSRIATRTEFAAMLRAGDRAFRRLLLVLRYTGARPGELRRLSWEHVDVDGGFFVIPDRRGSLTHKTASRQEQPRPRIIPLCGAVLRLVRRLARRPHGPDDPVFRNSRGKRWTVAALSSRRRRLQATAVPDLKAGERLCLYSLRHTFATAAVGRVTDLELAELMGHTQTRTTKKYLHLNPDRLRDIGRRAAGGD